MSDYISRGKFEEFQCLITTMVGKLARMSDRTFETSELSIRRDHWGGHMQDLPDLDGRDKF